MPHYFAYRFRNKTLTPKWYANPVPYFRFISIYFQIAFVAYQQSDAPDCGIAIFECYRIGFIR